VPDQVGQLIVGDAEMMCDTSNSAQRIVDIASDSEDLADYRVLRPREACQSRHCRPDAVSAAVHADGVE
jgi:hypothetical protein